MNIGHLHLPVKTKIDWFDSYYHKKFSPIIIDVFNQFYFIVIHEKYAKNIGKYTSFYLRIFVPYFTTVQKINHALLLSIQS